MEKTTRKSGTFGHKKSLGQHFLNNTRIPEKMADAGDVGKGDIVLEIGPGTGALTRELLRRGVTVIAVEADQRAIAELECKFMAKIKAKKLILIHADVRNLDLSNLGVRDGQYKVVANIPYYLSGMLFRSLLETKIQPKTLVFLVQREVAERIARDPKESILSLSVKVFGNPFYIDTVKPGNFTPPPKVDSAIIKISDISRKRLKKVSPQLFFMLLHEGFKSKRKQLLGNLSTVWGREVVSHSFSTLNIPQDARGEDISLNLWLKLAETLSLPKESTKNR